MFFIPCDNWKTLFFIKIFRTQKFGANAMLLSSVKQVFWTKYAFYLHYLRNNITMLLIP